ncbi:MAG TPA: GNAT family N-acetyltransferase [Mycobacteriales bacterium]|nr:GNAT family N-acetyltransferase [Mycobacteriales bacterium]
MTATAFGTPVPALSCRLPDGTPLLVRPLVHRDVPRLVALVSGAEPDAPLLAEPAHAETLRRFLEDVGHRDRLVLVAATLDGHAVGLAGAERVRSDRTVAEVAVAVAAGWQRRGVGTLLVTALARAAAEDGVRRFTALVRAARDPVSRLLGAVGAPVTERPAHGLTEIEIELPPAAELVPPGSEVSEE